MGSGGPSAGSAKASCNGIPTSPICCSRRPAQRSTRSNCQPRGGETFWVDLRAAYSGLPRQLRATIAKKRGIFDYTRRLAGYGREADQQISEEAKRLTPPVTHALVRAHPETGDRSLYLDSTKTVG